MATPHLQSLVIIEYIERFMKDIYNKSIKDLTITDATAGIGGDSINFGIYFDKVNSVEMSKERVKLFESFDFDLQKPLIVKSPSSTNKKRKRKISPSSSSSSSSSDSSTSSKKRKTPSTVKGKRSRPVIP